LDRFYVGHTADLTKRISEHNAGHSRYTSKACDWVLVFSEAYQTREAAKARETFIKSKKSRKYLEYLIKENS
jgi:putative endonuclease